MNLDAIPCKTDRARELLQQRDALPRAQRMFLIMVDGRKSLRDLSEATARLGIGREALEALARAGLIRWSRDGVAAAGPADKAPPAPAPAERAVSLGAVKMYAMDLVALMLPGQDHALRDASREVADAAGLRAWLARCIEEIGRRNDVDRAALFRARVEAQLPSGFLAAA